MKNKNRGNHTQIFSLNKSQNFTLGFVCVLNKKDGFIMAKYYSKKKNAHVGTVKLIFKVENFIYIVLPMPC